MTDESTFVWIAENTDGGQQLRWFYKVPQKRTWFDERIVKIRDALNSGQPDRLATTDLEELFQNLLPAEPAKSLLSAKSLVIVPDGALSLIPIEMLSPSASKGEYPLLTTATRYYPSIAALILARAGVSRPNWQAAFFGAGDPITEEESSPERSATADNSKNPGQKPPTLEEELSRIRSRGFWLGRLPATARSRFGRSRSCFRSPKK